MNIRFLSLFLAGFFFGGAVDHVILALMNSPLTAYGLKLGVTGNWLLACIDLVITMIFYWLFQRPSRKIAAG